MQIHHKSQYPKIPGGNSTLYIACGIMVVVLYTVHCLWIMNCEIGNRVLKLRCYIRICAMYLLNCNLNLFATNLGEVDRS